MFFRPTGVGKIELAKSLPDILFEGEKGLIRIGLSEYMKQKVVSRLIRIGMSESIWNKMSFLDSSEHPQGIYA
ncbi:unnamed protein product [Cochlearia groenlandica]